MNRFFFLLSNSTTIGSWGIPRHSWYDWVWLVPEKLVARTTLTESGQSAIFGFADVG